MVKERLRVYRLMSDEQLAAAVGSLAVQRLQIDFLREPPPPSMRAAILDALAAAEAEAERRRA